MAPPAHGGGAPKRRERRSRAQKGPPDQPTRSASPQRHMPRPLRPSGRPNVSTRKDGPETPPSNSTKPVACSAAPRSPHKTRARLAKRPHLRHAPRLLRLKDLKSPNSLRDLKNLKNQLEQK